MRHPDWPELLAAKIAANRRRPFTWGEHDCCLFAADCVHAMTGVDYAAEFRAQYGDARSAALALRRFGAGPLVETMTAKFGKPVAPLLARRGDVVMIGQDGRPALGICAGTVAWFAGRDGLVCYTLAGCRCAWRVD